MEKISRWIVGLLIFNLLVTGVLIFGVVSRPAPQFTVPESLRVILGDPGWIQNLSNNNRQEILIVPAIGSPSRIWVADLRSGIITLYEGDPATGGLKAVFSEKKIRPLDP